MLVSAKSNLVTPLPKRPGEDPTAEAAAGLQSVMTQALQNNLQAQTTQTSTQVEESATQLSTQQVNEATRISDNVDEAFAKTRVGLQATSAPLPDDVKDRIGDGSATAEFKDYMSKTPEQRMRDAILQEMGLTQEEIDQMPPEKQQAIGEEIAQRVREKAQMAAAEKDQRRGEHTSIEGVDKLIASL
ncbi:MULTISPECIES: hypothetical protein [Pseudomonas]|mgnify:FL=1|jgi:hypothetical protein|uniref:Uncharacterized protein n=1 Tax=Pseudomonas umsongensis TaxID=198618 RepID=A0AAE6ZTN7_9PSED|nr:MULTISPECIES: hypothetical protein [Pseudomonas]EPA97407.1 hypothetical protein PG5_21430 [Pseudomonas sp. G5(2012)]MBT9572889.1 hypothetical protein [Pseudomonas umsongensis]QJC77934.1 hypothetical protein HGP31_06335 [Pseudomonas umsongensis]